MRVNIPFVGGYHESRYANAQTCDNFMLRREGMGAKAPASLVPTPGLKSYVSAGPGPCRSNGLVFDNKIWFVSGNKLISIDENDAVVEQSTSLDTSSGRCDIDGGFIYLCVVDGQFGYSYGPVTGTPTFAKITDGDMPEADHVLALDRYFIWDTDSGFQISAVTDPTTIDPLELAVVEKRADAMQRPVWLNGRILAIGTETAEVYWNSGNIDMPFEATNIVFETGTPASWSAITGTNAVYMLSQSRFGGRVIVKVSAETPQKISNPDIEWQLNQMTTVDDAFAFTYEQAGQSFYQITFPAEDKTFCYDESTREWHTRSYQGGRSLIAGYGFFNGKHIVGDYRNSNFYTLDPLTYQDNSQTVIRERQASVIDSDQRLMRFKRFEIETKPGVGSTGGESPQLMLSWSDDGGNTWSNEIPKGIGKLGEYENRAVWHRLGTSRGRIFKLTTSDPNEFIITRAWADVEVGR